MRRNCECRYRGNDMADTEVEVELACELMLPDEPVLIASCVVNVPLVPSVGMQIRLDNVWWTVTCVLLDLDGDADIVGVNVVPEDESGLRTRGRLLAARWFEENDWTVLDERNPRGV